MLKQLHQKCVFKIVFNVQLDSLFNNACLHLLSTVLYIQYKQELKLRAAIFILH